jgi:hypothetical protein
MSLVFKRAKCLCLLLVICDGMVLGNIRSTRVFASSRLLAAKVDVEAASAKLVWEILEDRMARPVLNLSKDNDELLLAESLSPPLAETSHWDQGQRWSETREALKALDIPNPEDFLPKCPQLYRLETLQILETATWLIHQEGFGVQYIVDEPRALSYKRTDVEYGLEFLKMMTMSTSLTLLVPLLLSGIDGGIHERTVQQALSVAADATRQANQRIVGDAAASLQALKQKGSSPF